LTSDSGPHPQKLVVRKKGSGLEIRVLLDHTSAMVRPLRLEFPAAIYHITSCGNACASRSVPDDGTPKDRATSPRIRRRYRQKDIGVHQVISMAEPVETLNAEEKKGSGLEMRERNLYPAL
jgi:hypothetical protein